MWEVSLADEFIGELRALPAQVRIEVASLTAMLAQFGPQLGRPWADTLSGSRYANMKELRFYAADGVWRVAFAFDIRRNAVLLIAGDKAGVGEARFYRELIRKADVRFEAHLNRLRSADAAANTGQGTKARSPKKRT